MPTFQRLNSELRGVRVALLLLGPGPRMVVECGHQRLQLGEQLLAAGGGEGADDADRGELAVVVVEAEQQRADAVRPALVHAVAGDHAVGGAGVLDLEHGPLVGLVGAGQGFGHDAVESGAFELANQCSATSGRGWSASDGSGAAPRPAPPRALRGARSNGRLV